jgi:hypothetical protein
MFGKGTGRVIVAAGIMAGAATLLQSGATGGGPKCTAPAVVDSNFNATPIPGGNYIWFNANLTAGGIPSTGATLYFSDPTIQFTADQTYNVGTPNAQITFDPSATCATTSFDPGSNTFYTTVPVSGSDEIFLTGLAFPVPASFAEVNGKVNGPVIWQGAFGSSATNVSVNWKWGAAVYSSFTTDYNALGILPAHGNSCSSGGGDHAGTPEGADEQGVPYKHFVVGGARGGGGSNWTGSWSGTQGVSISTCH